MKNLRKQVVLSQTCELTLSDLKNALSGLAHFLQLKQRVQKLWHETWDPACKMALNSVTKTIGRMIQRNAIESWNTKMCNSEVTPQTVWPLANTLMKSHRLKARNSIHSLSGLIFLRLEKTNIIAECLENQFSLHDLCEL